MTESQLQERIATERCLVAKLIEVAQAHGYALRAVDDGEERVKIVTTDQALDAVFSVEESTIFFHHPDEPKSHCARIVLGNDGYDAIADHSQGGKWDAVMAEVDTFADTLCPN